MRVRINYNKFTSLVPTSAHTVKYNLFKFLGYHHPPGIFAILSDEPEEPNGKEVSYLYKAQHAAAEKQTGHPAHVN